MLFLKRFDTPVGEMLGAATDEGLCIFDYAHRKMIGTILSRVQTRLQTKAIEGDHQHFDALEKQLEEYLNGSRQQFTLPLHLIGSNFQVSVWRALQQIPYGETRSYKKQSIALGDENAVRAVARANGENGIAIIVPCHRVIGESGSLVGYSGGVRIKQWLLEHEKTHAGSLIQRLLFEI
ncbi:MAG TPA: methylated-DNA--[protein]-cysteine S-methyltransferase [Flavipsychrobacter sp.]|nr:methylated-DNA--[protein]-cysteine S-methyltransferase [Flavipsychrobacter sp.]